MADSLREAILERVKTELEAITVANGYETTVKKVYRTGQLPANVSEDPALVIVDRGDVTARLVQFAFEHRLQLEVRALNRDYVDQRKFVDTERLRADVLKALMQDETHGGYAVATFVQGTDTRISEATEPENVCLVTAEIQYRTVYNNPYQQQIL